MIVFQWLGAHMWVLQIAGLYATFAVFVQYSHIASKGRLGAERIVLGLLFVSGTSLAFMLVSLSLLNVGVSAVSPVPDYTLALIGVSFTLSTIVTFVPKKANAPKRLPAMEGLPA